MRATIPEEIKQARWIVKGAGEMLAEAKREAERVVKEARDDGPPDRRRGGRQAGGAPGRRHRRGRPRARARIALGAEDYADDILNTLEVNLTKFIAAEQRGRGRLRAA